MRREADLSPAQRRDSQMLRAHYIAKQCLEFATLERALPSQIVAVAMIATASEILAIHPADERDLILAKQLRDALSSAIEPSDPPQTVGGTGKGRCVN